MSAALHVFWNLCNLLLRETHHYKDYFLSTGILLLETSLATSIRVTEKRSNARSHVKTDDENIYFFNPDWSNKIHTELPAILSFK